MFGCGSSIVVMPRSSSGRNGDEHGDPRPFTKTMRVSDSDSEKFAENPPWRQVHDHDPLPSNTASLPARIARLSAEASRLSTEMTASLLGSGPRGPRTAVGGT